MTLKLMAHLEPSVTWREKKEKEKGKKIKKKKKKEKNESGSKQNNSVDKKGRKKIEKRKENQEKGKMRHMARRESGGKLPHLTNPVEMIKRGDDEIEKKEKKEENWTEERRRKNVAERGRKGKKGKRKFSRCFDGRSLTVRELKSVHAMRAMCGYQNQRVSSKSKR